MMLMIGVGHVFNIAEQVSFIIKNLWPEAILVELDERRYNALTAGNVEKKKYEGGSRLYRESANYQERMSEKNDVQAGGEMLAAINTGKLIGAEIICIDKDAEQVMKEVEEGMSFSERVRYSMPSFRDSRFGKKMIGSTQKNFAMNEEEYTKNMRKRFPTLVEKLVDERNEYMAEKIRSSSEKYKKTVIVVGDAHVRGLCEILDDLEIKKIRLAELLDKDSMDKIRGWAWEGEFK